MTLGDQLNELRGNILRDASDLIAGDSDRMWSDQTLLNYIQDAERRFARETMCLRDSTSKKLTRVTLREGVVNYPLDAAVFAVVSGRDLSKTYDLARTGHALVQEHRPADTLTWDPADVTSIQPGAPLGIYTDETDVYASQGVVTLSVFPTPDATAAGTTLGLRVVRIPCGGYTPEDLDRQSEIPLDYQFDVLDWAAYRAKRNTDADIGSMPNADAHRASFEDAIKRCKRDMRARRFVPMAVGYGRNGWAW